MTLSENTIKTVVSDFDGTLLRGSMNEPSDKFYRVLGTMLDQDIQFVAASGRQYPSLKRMLSDVSDKVGFIAENGALVVWKGKVIHKCVIEKEQAWELIEDMKRQPDSEILACGEKTSYSVPNSIAFIDGLHKGNIVVTVLPDFREIDEEIMKVSIIYPKGIPAEAKAYFKEKYEKRFLIVESGNGWLDFMPKECGKGPALQILSRAADFSLDQTVAFGDQENDISMLRTAGVGYAMNTAYDHVKKAADHTCDVVEDVLSEALGESFDK